MAWLNVFVIETQIPNLYFALNDTQCFGNMFYAFGANSLKPFQWCWMLLLTFQMSIEKEGPLNYWNSCHLWHSEFIHDIAIQRCDLIKCLYLTCVMKYINSSQNFCLHLFFCWNVELIHVTFQTYGSLSLCFWIRICPTQQQNAHKNRDWVQKKFPW